MVELRAQRGGQRGQHGDELFRGQRDADDAGGGRENLFRGARKDFRRGSAGGARGGQARFSGGTVGVPGVDGDNANLVPERRRFSLSMIKGAAVTRLAVNAAAAFAGELAMMRAKSVRPLCFEASFGRAELKAFGQQKLGCV